MKAIILASLLLTTAASAKPVAILEQSGGFCAERCPSSTISIEESGLVSVVRTSYFPAVKTERYTLAKLNSKIVEAIKRNWANVAPAQLVDLNPEGPICADIPMVRYSVVKDGQPIVIGEDRDCKEYRLETFEGIGIATVLKSVLELDNFAR